MAELRLADAREEAGKLGLLDGVLTSPPYPGVFDYVEENFEAAGGQAAEREAWEEGVSELSLGACRARKVGSTVI